MKVTRRKLVIGGVLGAGAVTLGWWFARERDRLGGAGVLPTASGEVALNGWLKLDKNGIVTVAVPRAEMGQGIHSAIAQMVAEEMDVAWESIRTIDPPDHVIYRNIEILMEALPFEHDDKGLLPGAARWMVHKTAGMLGVAGTGGSTSTRDAWVPVRTAGALARKWLLAAAAKTAGVPVADLSVADGVVVRKGGARVASYGDLIGALAGVEPPKTTLLKEPAERKFAGRSPPRIDVPSKVDGSAVFGVDVRLPNMLFGAIRNAPTLGGKPKSVAKPATLPRGVVQVVEGATWVAVLADNWWRAQRALENDVKIAWDEGPNAKLSSADLWRQFEELLKSGSASATQSVGDVEAALKAPGAKLVEAVYRAPYLAHATMEPMNCTARLDDNGLEIWMPNQSPSLMRWAGAGEAGLSQEKVKVHTTYLGGGFGRRAEVDVMLQAVACAKAARGRAVQLQWSREEDTQHDMYRPMALARYRGVLSADGKVAAWDARVVGQSASAQFQARLLGVPELPNPDTNAVKAPPYAFANYRLESIVPKIAPPVGFWRSVGHSHTAFFAESFMDELAKAAGSDPVDFRLAHLAAKPREAAVLSRAADMIGWKTPAAAGVGRGIALVPSFGSIVAQAAEVEIDGGTIKVKRLVCAIDCGPTVNPKTIEAQMMGGAVYGLSAALGGEITFADGKVEQSNFNDYPAIRIDECPAMEVAIVASTSRYVGGVGEPGTPPAAPAVANAVAALSGKRLRSLPLKLA